MRGRNLALSILLVAGGAAACSDDGGTDAQPYVDALVEELQDDGTLTDEEAECVAEGTIDALGADFLADNDITPEDIVDSEGPQDLGVDISEDQARGAAEAMITDCDVSFGASIAGEGASDEAVECINDNLDEDDLVDALTAEYMGDSEASDEQFEEMFGVVQTECGELLGG